MSLFVAERQVGKLQIHIFYSHWFDSTGNRTRVLVAGMCSNHSTTNRCYFIGQTFEILVSSYMRVQLQRGMPPLFTTLKSLYRDPEKVRIIDDVTTRFIDSLQKHKKFDENGKMLFLG